MPSTSPRPQVTSEPTNGATPSRVSAPRRLRAVALAAAIGLSGAVGVATAPLAVAHDSVVASNPGNGETVSTKPKSIELTFSDSPQASFNTVALSKDGSVLVSGTPTIAGRVLTLDIPDNVAFSKGEYTVGYQVTSSDGHATKGSYTFTYAGPESAAPATDTAASATAGSQTSSAGSTQEPAQAGDAQDDAGLGVPSWLLPVGGIVVLAGALAAAIAAWRRGQGQS